MEIVTIIVLIISICSLGISICALIRLILIKSRYESIISQYTNKLKRAQIEKIIIYNFIRQKRNKAIIKRRAFENGATSIDEKTRKAFRTCAVAAAKEEEVLKEIEDYIQKENLIEI